MLILRNVKKSLAGAVALAGMAIAGNAIAGNSVMLCESLSPGYICDAFVLSGTASSFNWSAGYPLVLGGPNGLDSMQFNCAVLGSSGSATLNVTYTDGSSQSITRSLACNVNGGPGY